MPLLIGVGANLAQSNGTSALQSCEAAVCCIAAMAGVTGVVRSRWFSSAPLPASDQPRFVNGVVRLHSSIDDAAFLALLLEIERSSGRTGGVRNAARTLDLDLLDAGGRISVRPDLMLPHPRAHLRAFVLLPLRDVAPGWVHPTRGPLTALVAALPPQDINAL